tara:strand:- start:1004 stop:1240 length:237 start_codon:yes stop_codon:yes gene_type:complete
MPQIGWFELLIVVLVAILFIGPKDFPHVLKKIGNWIGSTKRYFTEMQETVNKTIDDNVSLEEKYSDKSGKENKNEQKK